MADNLDLYVIDRLRKVVIRQKLTHQSSPIV